MRKSFIMDPNVPFKKRYGLMSVMIISGLVCFYSLNIFLWLRSLGSYSTFNFNPAHFQDVPFYWDVFLRHRFSPGELFSGVRSTYGPLYPSLFVLWSVIFGKSIVVATVLNNTIFMFAALFSVWAACRLLRNDSAGIIAAVMLFFYPAIIWNSMVYSLEFALTGMVALGIFILFKSSFFSSRLYSCLFGLVFGAGMMIKAPYVLFMAGPVCAVIFMVIKRGVSGWRRAGLNIVLAAAIAVAVMFQRYFTGSEIYGNHIFASLLDESCGRWHDWENLRVYTLNLHDWCLSPFFFWCFFAGAVIFSFSPGEGFVKAMLWSVFLIPEIVFIFMPHHKEMRFIVPALPALAILCALGIERLAPWFKRVVLVLSVIIGVIQFYLIVFNYPVVFGKNVFSDFFIRMFPRAALASENRGFNSLFVSFLDVAGGRGGAGLEGPVKVMLVMGGSAYDEYLSEELWLNSFWLADFPCEFHLLHESLVSGYDWEKDEADFIVSSGELSRDNAGQLVKTTLAMANDKVKRHLGFGGSERFDSGSLKERMRSFFCSAARFFRLKRTVTVPPRGEIFYIYERERRVKY